MQNILKFIYSIILVTLTAMVSGYFTRHGINAWYHSAIGNAFTPPDSVFPVVWSILYLLLAISFFLILRLKSNNETKDARRIFLSQLILQILWCFAFFYEGQLGVGLLIIVFMVWLAWKMLHFFAKLDHRTIYLLAPYLAWITYAAFLNLQYVIKNGIIVEF